MKKVEIRKAVGLRLAHDITEIIPGEKKVVAFERGKILEEKDIERLLDLGKKYVYVIEENEQGIHEEEAALRIAKAVSDEYMSISPPKEGRVNIYSKKDGLFLVDKERLFEINRIKDVLLSTIPDGYPAKEGDLLAATRIVPLFIREEELKKVEEVASGGVLRLKPFRKMKAALIITGDEVASGRKKDGSERIIQKLKDYGVQVLAKRIVFDDIELIKKTILELFEEPIDILITTAGLSVDPDDVTKEGIEAAGAEVLFYGTPIFPGAMFLLGRLKERYILGAPACVYHDSFTAFDIVLSRILADVKVEKEDIIRLSLGGLCMKCNPCHYPRCAFGKGS